MYRKEIKGKTRLESVEIQNQSVIEFASDDRRPGPGLFIRRFAKATDKTRIYYQIKTDFIFLVLRRGRGWEDTPTIVAAKAKMIVPISRRFQHCVNFLFLIGISDSPDL